MNIERLLQLGCDPSFTLRECLETIIWRNYPQGEWNEDFVKTVIVNWIYDKQFKKTLSDMVDFIIENKMFDEEEIILYTMEQYRRHKEYYQGFAYKKEEKEMIEKTRGWIEEEVDDAGFIVLYHKLVDEDFRFRVEIKSQDFHEEHLKISLNKEFDSLYDASNWAHESLKKLNEFWEMIE